MSYNIAQTLVSIKKSGHIRPMEPNTWQFGLASPMCNDCMSWQLNQTTLVCDRIISNAFCYTKSRATINCPCLLSRIHVNVQPTSNLWSKICVGQIYVKFTRCEVLIRHLQEYLGEGLGSTAHIISTMTKQLKLIRH